MIRSIVVAAACAVLVAGCGPQPPARPASSGVSSVDGGGEAQLGNTPRGTTNFPYSR